jgi:uncharacterized protein YbcC (UPF0753/DUF2309 family)
MAQAAFSADDGGHPGTAEHPPATELSRLAHEIRHAAHLLPAQGPINVFIHHNTLHAFEDLPFPQAVLAGAEIFGCEPFLPESRFRDELEKGRIRFEDLRDVLHEDLGPAAQDEVAGLTRRADLRLAMLRFPLLEGSPSEVEWFLEESDALRMMRPGVPPEVRGRLIAQTRHWVLRDLRGGHEAGGHGKARWRGPAWLPGLLARFGERSIEDWPPSTWEAFTLRALWNVCREKAAMLPPPPPRPEPVRHRDWLLRAAQIDTDEWAHEPLVRLCAAFVDQGVADWPLPGRDLGLFRCFLSLFRQPGHLPRRWLIGLSSEIERLQRDGVSPLQSVLESLNDLGVEPEEWGKYLSATLLALRGWGGIIRQIEERGERVPLPAPRGTLVELLAVRLILERSALRAAARDAGLDVPLSKLRDAVRQRAPSLPALTPEQRAFQAFQMAQALGWPANALEKLSPPAWAELAGEIESFTGPQRRRIFHLAYERRFEQMALDAIGLHAASPAPTPEGPKFQAVLCIDEREESFRRHLEEVEPGCETFGAAGFFGVAMYYRGAEDAHYIPKCPILLTPGHWVEEEPAGLKDEAEALRARRQALGHATLGLERGSRTFALGAVLSAVFGALASIPLVARVLFPRFSARFSRLFEGLVKAPARTRLTLERTEERPGPEDRARGYSPQEMAGIAERQLRDFGMTRRFARLALILGHGSRSLNNPHKSAYDCGACGGSPGGANGRALAAILNDPRIREALATRGLRIPEDTWFLGGLHNTCDDSVELLDTDLVPETHRDDLAAVRRTLDEACRRNAHERARRFWSAPLDLSYEEAKQHVEGRSEDMAQTRPELGHATNALCLIARRSRTRGLFLDRRAFLVSYDPEGDDANASILTRLLMAAVPVCGGINLEYYFSHIDSRGWGCGTKLPHNVASMLGVMEGTGGDLRTGLPWQMVEIHEPVRLLFVVETTPEVILGVMERNEVIGKAIRNGWVRLALLDPRSPALLLYEGGELRPYTPRASSLPEVPTSVDWYRGWRDHLEPARIGGGAMP